MRDTQLSGTVIARVAVGAAAHGLRPVAELQFMGFIYFAIDQLVNHAAWQRNRTRGRLSCPMVLRAPFGGGVKAPEHYSESMEAMLAHIPGLRVVIPSSPARAYGLLLSAIRDPDPVVFLEPKRLYRATSEEVAEDGTTLPLDTAFVLRDGTDVTLITWGAMVLETCEAADIFANQGVSAEVIDLGTVKPHDRAAVRTSVAKTGRCVIVHEAPLTADLAEHCLTSLLAPVRRVTGYDTIMPYLRIEEHYMPSVARILKAVQDVMEFT